MCEQLDTWVAEVREFATRMAEKVGGQRTWPALDRAMLRVVKEDDPAMRQKLAAQVEERVCWQINAAVDIAVDLAVNCSLTLNKHVRRLDQPPRLEGEPDDDPENPDAA